MVDASAHFLESHRVEAVRAGGQACAELDEAAKRPPLKASCLRLSQRLREINIEIITVQPWRWEISSAVRSCVFQKPESPYKLPRAARAVPTLCIKQRSGDSSSKLKLVEPWNTSG